MNKIGHRYLHIAVFLFIHSAFILHTSSLSLAEWRSWPTETTGPGQRVSGTDWERASGLNRLWVDVAAAANAITVLGDGKWRITGCAGGNIDTISGTAEGDVVIIAYDGVGGSCTLKHGQNNLLMLGAADIVLSSVAQYVMFMHIGTALVNDTSRVPSASVSTSKTFPLSVLAFRPSNGSGCTTPVYDRVANELPSAGGTPYPFLTCTDAAPDEVSTVLPLSTDTVPNNWAGSLQVTGIAVYVDVDGTPVADPPAGTVLGFNVSADCHRLPTTADDTFGTAQILSIPLTANEQFTSVTAATITASGVCTDASEATPVLLKIRLAVNTGQFNCPSGCSVGEMRLTNVLVKLIGS